jgi:hypothetical protein
LAILAVYSGDWPDHPAEREALLYIARTLDQLEEWFIPFVRLQIPGDGRPDLIVFKKSGIFIVELKHCEAPVFGGINGPWLLKEADGTVIRQLNEERERNPYQQVIWYWYSVRDFLA